MEPNVVIEVRPLLQACCAYVTSPSPEASARLVVRPDDLTITWTIGNQELFSQTISLPSSFPVTFQPCNVSSFLQEEKHISFRMQTAPRNQTGSFSMQIIDSNESVSQSQNVLSKPPIQPEVPCVITCACCGFNILLNEEVTFKRVLPLPSGSYDANDFFCHNHEGGAATANPNQLDCLYSTFSFQIHPSLVKNEESILHCKSCLAWIGTTSVNKAHLWHSTVRLMPVSLHEEQIERLDPACEFILLIKEVLNVCPLLVCRLVVDVKVSNGVTHYILIHVIDSHLTLLTAKCGEAKELVNSKVIKVSFRSEKHRSNVVTSWLNDSQVSCIEVALPVFVHGLRLLCRTSQLIPSTLRRAQHDFLFAYLSLQLLDSVSM